MLGQIVSNIIAAAVISAVLATIIVIAEKLFSNYGECTITINEKKKLTVKGGGNLLNSLASNKIFVPSACGGRGSCGFCKVKTINGAGPLLPTEKPYLSQSEMKNNIRLACQIKVRQDIQIEIPPELFNIQRFQAKVKEIIDYTYDTKGITFQLIEPKSISFIAGQYMQLEAPKYEKNKLVISRAYSISSNPEEENTVQLIIRRVPEGICTTYVHDYLKMDDIVYMTGPFGNFQLKKTENDIIFIAGGSGKAPIKSMVEHLQLIGSKRKMTYFFGARTSADLYLTEYFQEFEKTLSDFAYVPVLSQPEEGSNWSGKTGYIPTRLKGYLRDPKCTEAYLCGSPAMIQNVEKALLELGVPKDNISYDSFV